MNPADMPLPNCAICSVKAKICRIEDGEGPDFCPTINFSQMTEASKEVYQNPEVKEFARKASIQEGECYANRGKTEPYVRFPIKTRVQETIEFAHKCDFKRIGIAFCGGLHQEARIFATILSKQGFEVASVVCKVGRVRKEFLGIQEKQKVSIGMPESMCNPINQAKLLNAAKTDFNVLLGLCVGHDSLFMRYSEALCTVLVAKDRVTCHNPVAPLYLSSAYYARLKQEQFERGGAANVITTVE